MPTILLVRHGQASFGAADYDVLSERGHQQAALVAEELERRGLTVAGVRCGTLQRQRDTAAPTADAFGVTPTVDARWNEYSMDDIMAAHPTDPAEVISAGEPHGLTSAEFQDRLEHSLAAWIAAGRDSPARERWPDFATRVTDALLDAGQSLPAGSTGIVFTSGGVIAAACREVLDLSAGQLLALNRVAINTSVTKLIAGRRGVSLVSFNDHGHLERAGAELITYR